MTLEGLSLTNDMNHFTSIKQRPSELRRLPQGHGVTVGCEEVSLEIRNETQEAGACETLAGSSFLIWAEMQSK